ncbi:MAG: phospholipid/cholesterol/gamma-HCH transport system substrate-binding protein, partial [Mycobacterium sp.]|nr:phospholipid/cholesterol/gamma-HCH transport system substrate-binding protein [Mycobacterium sp.]
MSTVFSIRALPRLSRRSIIVTALALVLALTAAYGGWQLYRKLTTTTVVAYFKQANALYPGDEVAIMGVPVGSVDKVEPAGDKMKVMFHYPN